MDVNPQDLSQNEEVVSPPLPPPPPSVTSLPPEAQSIKDLVRIAGLISLIFGILWIVVGAVTLLFLIGIGFLIFGIFDLLIWMKCKEINELIDARRYGNAKDKTLVWMVIGFIIGGLIPGILLLVAFLKFDNLMRATQNIPPPPS